MLHAVAVYYVMLFNNIATTILYVFLLLYEEKTENQTLRCSHRKRSEPESGGSNVLVRWDGSSRWDSLMTGMSKMHLAVLKLFLF